MKTLFELYKAHTGKVSDKWTLYLLEYDRHFAPFREQSISLLEIGVQNGGSLEIWSQYFSNAKKLVGCDINADCAKLTYKDPRIAVIVGDATTPETKAKVLEQSTTFDVIIDDGSHRSSDIIKTFASFFSALKPGGLFVAEDLHCSYWQEYEGGIYHPYSSITFFKHLADIVNHEHWGIEKNRTEQIAGFANSFNIEFNESDLASISSIEFINSICIVRKKDAIHNKLGLRIAAGIDSEVAPIIRTLNGTSSTPIIQSQNTWSTLTSPPAETYFDQISEINAIKEQLTRERTTSALREIELQVKHDDIAKLNIEINSTKERLSKESIEKDQLQIELKSKHDALAQERELHNTISLELEKCKQIVSNLNIDISQMRNSRSWRITAPLRALKHTLNKPVKAISLYKNLRKENSASKIFLRSIDILRRDGWYGIKARANSALKKINSPSGLQSISTTDTEAATNRSTPPGENLLSYDLNNFDVISLDVFDTAIIRLLRHPTDIFQSIEERYKSINFRQWRINREKIAREFQTNRNEIDITDIYRDNTSEIPREIQEEVLYCTSNPEVFEFYRRARQANKTIVFISDMYLRKEDIEHLLRTAGYTARDNVYVSSEDGLLKGDGTRFERLAAEWKKSNLRVLHVGDNKIADYDWPKRHGIQAINYQSTDEFFSSDELLNGIEAALPKNIPLRISTLLGSYRFWKLGLSRSKEITLWHSLGFLFAGPLLYSFARALDAKVNSTPPNSNIFFLARDGDILKQVFEIIYPKSKRSFHYLLASRRCMTFPLFCLPESDYRDSILRLYTICDEASDAIQIMKRIGHWDLKALHNEFSNLEATNSFSEDRLKSSLNNNMSSIKKHANEELSVLLGYLEQTGFLNCEPLLIDVGWSGTIQDCLGLITLEQRKNVEIHGAYLGVLPNSRETKNKIGFLFDSGKPQLALQFEPFLDFIELLTSSPQDSVKSIHRRFDGSYSANYFEPNKDEILRQQVAKEIQRGALEYATFVTQAPHARDHSLAPEEFLMLCKCLASHSSQNIRRAFSRISHARMPNGSHDHPILHFREIETK